MLHEDDKKTPWIKLLAPVFASIAGLLALRLLGPDVVDQRQLSAWLRPLGSLAPFVFVLFLAVRPVTLLPGQLFTAVGGLLFGTVLGSLYALLGSFLAAGLVFLLGQKLGSRLMRRLVGHRYPALEAAARKHDFKFALLTCINPLVPTDVAVAASSASGARFFPTALGVLLGTFPGTFLTAQFGSALGQGKTILIALSAVGMVVSLVLGVAVGRSMVRDIRRTGHATAPAAA